MPKYIGLDLHKEYAQACVWEPSKDKRRQFRLPSDPDSWSKFIKNHVDHDTFIALEATGNAFWVHDILAPHAAQVVVANPLALKRYGDGRHTDRVDAQRLAEMLALGTLRPVWVPPPHIRQLRSLLRYRHRLVSDRTRTINRARGALRQHGVSVARNADPWEAYHKLRDRLPVEIGLLLGSTERQRDGLNDEIELCTAEIARRVLKDETAQRLMSLPGVGPLVAAAITAYIGDATRFRRAKQVVRFAGLDPSVHQSGELDYRGRISKNGPPLLRVLLVQAANQITRTGRGPLADFYKMKAKQLGRKRAVVAVARKLLIAAWRLMRTNRLAHETTVTDHRRKLQKVKSDINRITKALPDWVVASKESDDNADAEQPGCTGTMSLKPNKRRTQVPA